jgi:hypothetical protein
MCLAVRHFFGPLASASFPSFVSNRALSSLQPRLLATDLKSSAPRYWAPCFPGSFLGTSGVIQVPSCDYVAFIDESGDPSVRRVKPLDYPGSSEWMTVSVVVIRAESEQHATSWVEAIISKTASSQMQRLHFSKLAPPGTKGQGARKSPSYRCAVFWSARTRKMCVAGIKVLGLNAVAET